LLLSLACLPCVARRGKRASKEGFASSACLPCLFALKEQNWLLSVLAYILLSTISTFGAYSIIAISTSGAISTKGAYGA
jgi:hypothetical protein